MQAQQRPSQEMCEALDEANAALAAATERYEDRARKLDAEHAKTQEVSSARVFLSCLSLGRCSYAVFRIASRES